MEEIQAEFLQALWNQTEPAGKGALIENLQKKIRRLESDLEKRSEVKNIKDDHGKTKDEIVRWEESKKWQAKMEKVKTLLKEKERDNESLSKQLSTLKDLYARLEQEKAALQKKLKARGVTADQVVGARANEMEREIEELKKKNSELETQIETIRQQQALPRDDALENLMLKNQLLQERLHSLEGLMSKEPPSRPSRREISSQAFSGICSITFDVEDETCIESTPAQLPKSCSCSLGLEPPGDTLGQQGEPMQSQADGETQSCFAGEEDAEQDRPNHDGDSAVHKTDVGNAADHTREGERRIEADAQENIPVGSEVTGPAEQEEPHNKKGDNVQPEEQSGRTESIVSPAASQAETDGGTSESEEKGDVWEPRDEDVDHYNDVRVPPEAGKKAAEEEDVTTRKAIEEWRFCSAQPDDDSDIALSKRLEGLGIKREKPKQEALNYLKTSGRGTGTPSQRDQDLSKENLKLASENLELRLQLEQANKDLPRLKNQIADLKEMCSALKKERAEVEKKLTHIRGAGYSGKTVPELEKTIGLLKKVVERVQRENEALKKSSMHANQDKFASLEKENEKLKADYEKLRHESEAELRAKLESKTKGLERIVVENERLRKEVKREMEAAEKLRVTKMSLEATNKKLESELEETKQRLRTALSKAVAVGSDSKAPKATVVTRMFENKMKELERELTQKTSSVSELRQQLKEAEEREERAETRVRQLEDQVDMLQRFPGSTKTAVAHSMKPRAVRQANTEPERTPTDLKQKADDDGGQESEASREPGYGNLKRLLLKAESEKSKLQTEVTKLRKELANFDPTFFDELEDLKYNYNLEVKKNILLEEQLKKLCDRFGVTAARPSVSIS